MKTWIGTVECGICQHVQRSQIEIDEGCDEPIVPLECAECGNMACTPVPDDEGELS